MTLTHHWGVRVIESLSSHRDSMTLTHHWQSKTKSRYKVDRTPPPPPGGGSYWLCFLLKNRVEEDPPRRTWYKSFEGGPLTHGSWWRNIVNRKPPRGGGFFRWKCRIVVLNGLQWHIEIQWLWRITEEARLWVLDAHTVTHTHWDWRTLTHHWGSETLSCLVCRWRGSFICVTWLHHMCDMTHSYVWLDSFIRVACSFLRVPWLIHMCDMTHSCVCHDSFLRVTRLIHVCDMTHLHAGHAHSYVWHASSICGTCSFMCVTWLIPTCDMPHSYVWHDSSICGTCSFICVTCLIHTCDMLIHICDVTHSYVWHASFIRVTWLIYMRDMLIQMWDVTHSYVWHASFMCVTWLMYMWDMLIHMCVTWLEL